MIVSYQIPVKKIFAGKFRRYLSGQNFVDPFLIALGFMQSFFIVISYRPSIVVAAGGFVAVPLAWAAKLLGVPVLIHQQDVVPGLANLLMARTARKITVTFPQSLSDFFIGQPEVIGNPVREDILQGDRPRAGQIFKLEPNLPTLLVIGGGTGALALNEIVNQSLSQLLEFCQVIHLTGGKAAVKINHPRYHQFDFLTDQLKDAYAAADLVVSRAGLSVLTELSALGKPALIIPIPHSHQEKNATEFFKHNAIILVNQDNLSPAGLVQAVRQLLADDLKRQGLSRNISQMMPKDAAAKMAEIIFQMV